jgi:hypothetical protein
VIEPAGPTWHISTDDMYPAVMDSLVKLHDRVDAIARDVAALRDDLADMPVRIRRLEGFRAASLVALAVFVLGMAVVAAAARF